MVNLPLVFGIVAVAAVPAAGLMIDGAYHDLSDDGCAVLATQALGASEGRLVQVRIHNLAEAADLRACVLEGDGPERHEAEIALQEGADHVFRVRVGDEAARIVLELDRPGWEFSDPVYAIVASSSSIPECNTGVPEVVFETEYYGNGSGISARKPGCVPA